MHPWAFSQLSFPLKFVLSEGYYFVTHQLFFWLHLPVILAGRLGILMLDAHNLWHMLLATAREEAKSRQTFTNARFQPLSVQTNFTRQQEALDCHTGSKYHGTSPWTFPTGQKSLRVAKAMQFPGGKWGEKLQEFPQWNLPWCLTAQWEEQSWHS